WNLHTFSLGMELDWMVLYSSAASLFGSPGQSNYAAANSFLDSLAYFRNSRGMPTLGVNWGAWSGVGMASRMTNSDTNRMRQGGMEPLDPKEAMSELAMSMDDHRAQCAILDVEWDRIFTTFPIFSQCHYFATLRDSDNTGKQEISTAGGSLKTFAPGTGKESLRELISAELRYVLQLPEDHEIEGDRGFFEMGMDSLTAVEFRNRVQRSTALELNSSVVFDYPNIRTFSNYLERLLQSGEVENTEPILPEDSDIALLLEQELNALERDKVHG
ncbi:MAG: polyketide synthase, partial [Verrucomicrobiales bacterium]|nr:polyketide synthase [Verrucomicrobiales bacterium]